MVHIVRSCTVEPEMNSSSHATSRSPYLGADKNVSEHFARRAELRRAGADFLDQLHQPLKQSAETPQRKRNGEELSAQVQSE